MDPGLNNNVSLKNTGDKIELLFVQLGFAKSEHLIQNIKLLEV
jgi:hypothetical protein